MTRSPVQQWAGFYAQSLGWSPVPLVPRDKKCIIPGYLNTDFQPDAFRDDANIGLKSNGGVTFFDDDLTKRGGPWKQLGDAFLPSSSAIYGRPSAPRSKRLYLCPTLTETWTWTDLNGEHLHQLRVGVQDMVPPSWHPDGERLKWDKPLWNGMLVPIDSATLIAACNLRATAALIALHWPKHGRRKLRLAYARVLLNTLGLPEDTTSKVIALACVLGSSDANGVWHAAKAVRDTKDALAKNEKAIGASYIRSVLPEGAELLRRLREWFGKTSEVEEAVEGLNDTFFVIDVGTETVVGEHVIQSDTTRQWSDIRVRPFADFKKKLVKSFVKTGTKRNRQGEEVPLIEPLADVWLKHKAGAQYDHLIYAPEGSGIRVGPRDLNGWKGFTVLPAPGDWSLTRDTLIKRVMCRDNEDLLAYTLDWFAALFQKPGQHAETSLGLLGPQGVGKTFVVEFVLGRTFDGRHFRLTTHTKQVLGEFNDILSGLCLLGLDEAGLNTPAEYNAMKGLITGHTLDINRKGIRIETERSMLHVIFLSNEDVPLKVAADDRRFAFYQFSDTHANDTSFFGRLTRELDEQGGRAAMLHELLARKVNWDRLRLAPETQPKQTAKRESWTPAQWFFFRMLRETGDSALWVNHEDQSGCRLCRLKKSDTAAYYLQYLAEIRSRHEVKDAKSELHNELKKLVPKNWDFNRGVSEGGVLVRDYWTLPDWDAFVASFSKAVGCDIAEQLALEMKVDNTPTSQLLMDVSQVVEETPDEKHFADADEFVDMEEF